VLKVISLLILVQIISRPPNTSNAQFPHQQTRQSGAAKTVWQGTVLLYYYH